MSTQEPKFYRYILASDDGMAPCIDDRQLTLATCKPRIRSVAKPGDWVAGFYPGAHDRGRVSWIGRVSRRMEIGDFEAKFRGRSDAVYRPKPDGTYERLRPKYHPGADEFRKDTCAPVLVFDADATWYFGDQGKMLPDQLMGFAAKGQNHRVNFRVPGDLGAIRAWLDEIGPPGYYGRPRDARDDDDCGGCATLRKAARIKSRGVC